MGEGGGSDQPTREPHWRVRLHWAANEARPFLSFCVSCSFFFNPNSVFPLPFVFKARRDFPVAFSFFLSFFRFQSFTKFYRVLPSFPEFCRVLSGFMGFYRALSGFMGFYRVLLSFTEFYRVLSGFIGFYRVLPGFTGFYRVLPGFTEFYRVLWDSVSR